MFGNYFFSYKQKDIWKECEFLGNTEVQILAQTLN